MAEEGMPLLVHGEVTSANVDVFDKEAKFIEEVLKVKTVVILPAAPRFNPSEDM